LIYLFLAPKILRNLYHLYKGIKWKLKTKYVFF
jgi:hypothetical protein